MRYKRVIQISYEDYPQKSQDISSFFLAKIKEYDGKIRVIKNLGYIIISDGYRDSRRWTHLQLTDNDTRFTHIVTIYFEENGIKTKDEMIMEISK